jgi:large subunit ribosomal protein L21
MYAIIETGGKQYRVSPGETFDVELLPAERHVTFDKVLMVVDGDKFVVGTPYIKGAKVAAKVLGRGRDDKVTTFKFKNKINYHKTKGHRQPFTTVRIEEVKHGT